MNRQFQQMPPLPHYKQEHVEDVILIEHLGSGFVTCRKAKEVKFSSITINLMTNGTIDSRL